MTYQKLQGSRALNVVPSDSINIPKVNSVATTGSATATVASKLVDSNQNFSSKLKIGDIVYNNTDSTAATVTAIDSATQVSLSADIMASGESYTVYYAPELSGCALFVSGAGTVKLETPAGDIVTLTAIAGSYLPIQAVKVFATGTSATGIVAIW